MKQQVKKLTVNASLQMVVKGLENVHVRLLHKRLFLAHLCSFNLSGNGVKDAPQWIVTEDER